MNPIEWTYRNGNHATGKSADRFFEIVRRGGIWIASARPHNLIAKGYAPKVIGGGKLDAVIDACEGVERGERPLFAVRSVHLGIGWRYWAFHINTGHDREFGLDSEGYGSEAEAWTAIARSQVKRVEL